ncbi:MAG: XRE family transcriptional regulator [Candidatus Gastranaerophilaceae bacterium]|jgi:Zn-dependent peptidase ImmA (M78 family)/DNA-binding XRE family transcriptional regulator
MFNKDRFKLAREIRKMSKQELSNKVRLSVQTLTEWEKGNTIPKLENLYELSKILNFSVDFFNAETNYSIIQDTMSFRALTKMKACDRDVTFSYAKLAIDLAYWIDSKFNLPEGNITFKDNETPETAANRIRNEWELGECIDDTIFLLEKKGIKVFSLLDDIEYIDGFSFWNNKTPFVLLTHKKSAEHSRFDAMHELGHLILHHNGISRNKNAEKEAHLFAAEILMPKIYVEKYKNITPILDNFMQLKKRWKVSLSALIYRFYQLGFISEWSYRTLYIEMRKKGYSQNEPQSIQWEESIIINKIFKLLQEDNCSIQDISNETSIPVANLNKLIFNKFSLTVLYGSGNNSSKSRAKLTLIE